MLTIVFTSDKYKLISLQSITVIFLPNFTAKFSALSLVRLVSIIFGVSSFNRENITDLDAPPAPNIKAVPLSALHSGACVLRLLIKPIASVLSANIFPSLKIRVFAAPIL